MAAHRVRHSVLLTLRCVFNCTEPMPCLLMDTCVQALHAPHQQPSLTLPPQFHPTHIKNDRQNKHIKLNITQI
eukprot:2933393-Pleurochrysis_carterae.AAC.2